MIITQVHFELGTIKCAVLSHNTMPQMSQVLRECGIYMLTAGMFTRAVAPLQLHFREFGSTSNRPLNHRPGVTMPAQDLHIRLLHLRDHLRPATQTADETEKHFCVIKPFCGKKLILISCAHTQSCEIHRFGPDINFN
jgi:hypothetical protein